MAARRLAALGWALMAIPTVVSADCAAGSSTLTTESCAGCGAYDLCLGFTSKSDCSGSGCETDGDCTYQCFSVDENLTTLDVLVDFGGFKSAQETAAGGYTEAALASYPDFTDTWPSVSNDDVTTVSTIELSAAVQTFIMSGGTAAVNYPQGKVSSVTLTGDFISSATAVTRVVLQNLALTDQADDLPGFLPSTVTNLELTNTLLSKFPVELGSLASLQQLILDDNYITTVDSLDVIDSITTLSLESNSIKAFTGVFTNLEYLFVSSCFVWKGSNNLTSVPTAIYKHSYLKKLNLTGNPFTSREFTRGQAEFLNNLETLYLSSSDFTVGLECDDSQQVVIQDVTVCLGSGVTQSSSDKSADATSTTTSDTTSDDNNESSSTGTDGSDTKTTSASDSSSSTSLIVGIVCGVLVVLFVAFLFVLYRRKHREAALRKLGDSFGYSGTRFPSIDSDLVLQQQPYDGLRTSAVFGAEIPMTSTEFSMANRTAGGGDDDSMGIPTSVDGSMGIPTSVDGSMGIPTSVEGSSAYPSSVPTVEAERNPNRFMSIWNDPELLSLQVRAVDVKDMKQLGSGAFAMVWLVRYRDSQLLASKRLRPERRTKRHTATFIEEIKLIAQFDHPNLVNFVGAAWTIESDLQALMEYMEGGDLRQYLADPDTPVGWTNRKFDIAIGIIEALVYLHSFVPQLVHRDLKSKNVLLSSDFQAKLSDFGASRFRSVENTMTGGVGTGRWLAPEVIRGDTDYGSAADIYSFGALLTELDTNKIPYSNAKGSNGKILSDMTILHRVATGKLHPQLESDCSPALRDLVERCFTEDQSQRPAAPIIAHFSTSGKKGCSVMMRVLAAVGLYWMFRAEMVSGECAGGSTTLTTESCSACDDYDLCLGFTSASSCSGSGCVTDGDCTYECLAVDETSTTLIVLVVFGDYESTEEVAARASGDYDDAELSGSGYSDYTSTWPWVSNDQVATIDTVTLSSAVTTFMISGGNSSMEYPKSKVADVTLGPDLISSDSSVTQVVLHNLNLENQVDSLADLLPSSVKTLNIGNGLIQSFPTALSGISSLQELYMDLNYVTSVNSTEVIDALTYLFTAVFPNLEYLYLTGNSFSSMRFTQSEIDFLDNLTVLGLDSTDFSVELHCDESKKTVVHDVTVCLSEESDAGTASTSTASTSTDATSTASTSTDPTSSSSTGSGLTGTTTSSESSSSVSVGAIVGIVCGVVAVLAIGIGLFVYCRRQKKAQRDKLMETDELAGNFHASNDDGRNREQTYAGSTTSGASMSIPTRGSRGAPAAVGSMDSAAFLSLWNDPELLSFQVRADDIEDIRQLGSGAYATVWLVRYRESQLLASKRMRPELRSKQRTSAFVEEIKLVASFEHPNLVKFIGAAWTIESDLQALLEYMDGGDLRDYLASANAPLDWTPEKFDIALGVVEALVYLHSFLPPLVHRDLKSRNVLLSSTLQAKLSDFGTSRFRSEENTMTVGVGTGRWLAPEVITGDTNYGPPADIYSYGVLLTELDTNEIPYSSARGANDQALSDMAILHQVATAKLRPVVGNRCPPPLRDLVDRCLVHDPSKRPTGTVIAYELRRMRNEVVGA
uniref:Protein kinase domain-containing protein n=1 Tax=Phytophthora ramorum TaxID=164328 RepID=H3GM04_PHYRM